MSVFFSKNSVAVVVVVVALFFFGLSNGSDDEDFSDMECVNAANGDMYDYNMTSDYLDWLRMQVEEYVDDYGGTSRPTKHQLIGSCLRLMFHDCGGPSENQTLDEKQSICDGCIDFNNSDHAGLKHFAVEPLEMMYKGQSVDGTNGSYPNWCAIMSRADFWATVSTMMLEYSWYLFVNEVEDDSRVNDTFPDITYYFGREDCMGSPDVDTEAVNYVQKSFPDAEGDWDSVLDWFYTNFEFTERQIVAILGAHTVGTTHNRSMGSGNTNSGENFGPWVVNNYYINNDYYLGLFSEFLWTSILARNNEWLFVAKDHEGRNNFYIMLNIDGAMIADYDNTMADNGITFLQSTGEVTCLLSECSSDQTCDIDTCPNQTTSYDIAREYEDSNQIWLIDFMDTFYKMIKTGYANDELTEIEVIDTTNYFTTSTTGTTDKSYDTTVDDSYDDGVKKLGGGGKGLWSVMVITIITVTYMMMMMIVL